MLSLRKRTARRVLDEAKRREVLQRVVVRNVGGWKGGWVVRKAGGWVVVTNW